MTCPAHGRFCRLPPNNLDPIAKVGEQNYWVSSAMPERYAPRNNGATAEAVAAALARVRAVVDEQAEDEGLWFAALTAPEAYLQQELRRLHAIIEEAGR